MQPKAICTLLFGPLRFLLKLLLLMRMTCILLLAGLLQVSAHGYGQEKISLSEKNAPLDRVFADIQKQTSYNIWYDKSVLQNTSRVSMELKDATLEEVLAICCKDQPVAYSVLGNNVVIRQKINTPEPLANIDVKGKVVNEKGEPVAGASIVIKGTATGVMSGADGSFILKDLDEKAVLIFSGANIEIHEEKLNGRKEITVVVKTHTSKLDDVQVIGYGTTTKRLNTGSVSTVTAETIEEQPVSNVLAAIEGRVTGLNISQQTGAPGGAFTVQIRGQNSIANGNDPLYIVDGVPFPSVSLSNQVLSGGITFGGSPLNSISPDDIESIDVLKDADATAIYGSRGANGVILISTKKGKEGKTKLDLNLSTGRASVGHFVQLMNTPQYLAMRHEAFANDGAMPDPSTDFDLTTGTRPVIPIGKNY